MLSVRMWHIFNLTHRQLLVPAARAKHCSGSGSMMMAVFGGSASARLLRRPEVGVSMSGGIQRCIKTFSDLNVQRHRICYQCDELLSVSFHATGAHFCFSLA